MRDTATKTRLLLYFSTYRWELWLIIGIPAVVAVVRTASIPMLAIPFNDLEFNDLEVSAPSIVHVSLTTVPINAGLLVAGIVGLILLSVSYLRVRRLEREFLASLWGYSIAVALIGFVVTSVFTITNVIVVAVAAVGADPGDVGSLLNRLSNFTFLFSTLLRYLALLWFARQLSRVSLTHAFFLVAFTSLYLSIPVGSIVGRPLSPEIVWAANLNLLIGGFVGLIVMLIKVWLLGNFDLSGERFRKEAIIILVATVVLGDYARVALGILLGYLEVPRAAILPLLLEPTVGLFNVGLFIVIGLVFNLVTLLVLFGSVYLVRVRQPKTLDAPPVPAS